MPPFPVVGLESAGFQMSPILVTGLKRISGIWRTPFPVEGKGSRLTLESSAGEAADGCDSVGHPAGPGSLNKICFYLRFQVMVLLCRSTTGVLGAAFRLHAIKTEMDRRTAALASWFRRPIVFSVPCETPSSGTWHLVLEIWRTKHEGKQGRPDSFGVSYVVDSPPAELNRRLRLATLFASKMSPLLDKPWCIEWALELAIQSIIWSGIRVHGASNAIKGHYSDVFKDLQCAIADVFGEEAFARLVMSFVPDSRAPTP